MEILKVTKDIAVRAVLAGACRIPKVGTPVSEFPVSDLLWAGCLFTKAENKSFRLPLWTLSGYGSGSGSGYGDGYGDGYGSGYGDGSGYGSGYGDGYGDGEDICVKILEIERGQP